MENETTLVDGLFFDRPREGAPEFVKGRISIQADKLTEFVAKHKNEKGYVNIDLLKSKEGKLYCKLNTWKPEATPEITKGDIPF